MPLADSGLLDAELLAQNAVIALLLILWMLASGELFNATFEDNYDEIRGWFGFAAPLWTRLQAITSTRRAHIAGLVAFLAVTGVVGGLLDPGFGFTRASLALFFGIASGLALITAVFWITYTIYMRRVHHEKVSVRVIPGGLVVALLCVAISRLVNFEPGYLYGIIAGMAVQRELTDREEGKIIAFTMTALLTVSVGAWLSWVPVAAAAEQPGASLAILVLDSTLAAVFVAGVEILAFGLLPMRFLDGAKLKAYNKIVWLLLLGLGMFSFVHVLLHPEAGLQATGPIALVVGLFIGFAVFSIAFWAYFRYRRPRPVVSA